MKSLICITLALALVGICTPAAAQYDIYDNGPINGTTDGWTINFGYTVSDSFTLGYGPAHIDGLQFGAWLFPGDVLQSAELSITSQELGGTTYFDQVVNFTQSDCVGNQYGYNVCVETGMFDVRLNAGTYWLNLQNATVNTGDPIYWDENSGPSSASQNSVGTIPSEAFTLTGPCADRPNGCGPPPTTPEPGGLLLLGSGVLAVLASRLRSLVP